MTNINLPSAAGFIAAIAHMPIKRWRASCVPERHEGSSQSWEIEGRTEYDAGVALRAQLQQQGIAMPADLEWTVAEA